MNGSRQVAGALALGVVLLLGTPVWALINPSLQPMDLAKRYKAVIGTTITQRDEDNGTMTLKVTGVFSGKFAAKEIKITTVDATRDEPIFLDDGQPIAAFVGGGRKGDRVIFYTGSGIWQRAELKGEDMDRWEWVEVLDGQEVNSLFGCFNGDGARLVEMMADLRDGTYYFPPRPFQQFSQLSLGKFDSPLRGVALCDVDGDGDLDAYGLAPVRHNESTPMRSCDSTRHPNMARHTTQSTAGTDSASLRTTARSIWWWPVGSRSEHPTIRLLRMYTWE